MFSYKGTANTAVIFISDKIRRTFHYPYAITESIRYNTVSIQYDEDKEMTTKKLIQAIAADALEVGEYNIIVKLPLVPRKEITAMQCMCCVKHLHPKS